MKLVIAISAALAAMAVAQVAEETTITGADGTLRVERRQSTEFFEVANTVSNLVATVSRLEASNQALNSQMAAGGTAAAVASDMASRTMGLMSSATANQIRLDATEATLASVQGAVTTQLNAMQAATATAAAEQAATLTASITAMEAAAASTAAAQSTTLAATVTRMTGTMDTRINAVLASLGSTATVLRSQQSAGASSLTAAVNVQLRRVNTSIDTVTAALAAKRSATSHLFVGSCSNHGNGAWRDYCYNRVEIDSSRPMFRKENDTRMRSIVAGYFYMHFHRMLQTCNWAHTLLYYNGSHRIHTHDWQGGNSRWRDDQATMTYPLGANQQFWARVWNGCWSTWNTSTSHTKFHAMYKGAIPS